MNETKRPLSSDQAPDTATVYERAKPEKEAGMGRLDNNANATPTRRPDKIDHAATNKQNPENQINGEDVVESGKKKSL